VWSPKGTTLRVIRCPTLQVSQFLFPGQRSDTFLTDHVYEFEKLASCASVSTAAFKYVCAVLIFPDINLTTCMLLMQ